MIGNIMEWWSNFRKQRKLDKLDGLMDMSDVKLGRKTRRYFYRHDNMMRLNTCLKLALPEVAFLIGCAVMLTKTGLIELCLVLGIISIMSCAILFSGMINASYYWSERTMYRSFNRGDIGKVMEPFIEWHYLHYRIMNCGFKDPYTPGRILFESLLNLPFVSHSVFDDMDEFKNIDDWSNEDLGQFMKLMIGCIAIYVKGDGKPSRKALAKFIDESNSRDISWDILSKVALRRYTRTHAESIRHNREKEKLENESISLAESMKNKIAHEQPDKDNPDYARILNLKKKLDEKADELRLEAQP